ncbi:helix-turn-helix domain-containing protein [Mesorhizobium sp. BR1-1-2]|uniref:helix-turn-helix domain-containing protein n=1 Tax=Mesorhizobium sp. BR1-1-2 TaxID=2876652 RepID=UPI001CCFB691|nr:helix-turn-helix transcriptional regulator [Mesorhizobium sp. BR1-1-2]MBZ9964210.1 helix-turn-helix transcriptional regulator [Mesorhizobium sp. BR1-1-2]
MIAGQLRECLKTLRWKAADLVDELGCPQSQVAAWLDGRTLPPLSVVAWLEALARAHRALPAPGWGSPMVKPSPVEAAEIRLAAGENPTTPAHPPYPRRPVIAHQAARHASVRLPSNGGLNHGTDAL